MKTFKDWIKDWDLEQIVHHCFIEGMKYMATDILKDWEKDKIIIINELNIRNNMNYKDYIKQNNIDMTSDISDIIYDPTYSDLFKVKMINDHINIVLDNIHIKIEAYRRTRLNEEVLEAIDDILNIIK